MNLSEGGDRQTVRPKAVIMDGNGVKRAVARITYEILERNKGASNLCIIGILSRGAYLAQRVAGKIAELENLLPPVGLLDVTPYRDDGKGMDVAAVQKERTGLPSVKDQSKIDFPVQERRVILMDDVIYTGRTTRAAIDALMARGRPQSIQLAVLIDRGHRELPIRPDYVGKNVPTSREESVRVRMMESDGRDEVVING